jgi:hypothetical protein
LRASAAANLHVAAAVRSTSAAEAEDDSSSTATYSLEKGRSDFFAASNTAAVSFFREGVYSDVPEAIEDQQGMIRWYRGIKDDMLRNVITRQQATLVRALSPGGANMTALPLSQCPGRCLNRGQCIKTYTVGPRCLCWQGYTGNNCEQVRMMNMLILLVMLV